MPNPQVRELPDGRVWNGLAYIHNTPTPGCLFCEACKKMNNIHNFTTPNWGPLERAVSLLGRPKSELGSFMWMCEQPEGVHQYKHRDTRNYAMLRADSTVDECKAEIANAFSWERTWGKQLDARLRHA